MIDRSVIVINGKGLLMDPEGCAPRLAVISKENGFLKNERITTRNITFIQSRIILYFFRNNGLCFLKLFLIVLIKKNT